MGIYRFSLVGLMLLGTAIGTTGCLFADPVEDTDASPQIIRTVDDSNQLIAEAEDVQVILPQDWQEAPENSLHDSADLYAENEADDLFLVVVGEPQSAIQTGSEDLIAYRYRQLITQALDDYENPRPTQADAVGGYPTIQYEIRGTLDDNEIVYLHTTVFVEDMVYQVVGWTTESAYADHQDELQEVISSFRVI